jgi:hypothetical protein
LLHRDRTRNWKLEYENTLYKIYDWKRDLAGYFFPNYNILAENNREEKDNVKDREAHEEANDDEIIEEMNKRHGNVRGGNVMLPMLKLALLDNQDGMNIEYTIEALDGNLQRAKQWREWLEANAVRLGLVGCAVYTAREDRNMLSIVLGIDNDVTLGEKELSASLSPLLDKLHEDGLL